MGSLRKLHNEELHDVYSSPNSTKLRIMRWQGHVVGNEKCLQNVGREKTIWKT